MNLGFLDGGTAAHEFGHAIGLAHEHQNPAGGIQWNEEVVHPRDGKVAQLLGRGHHAPQRPAQVQRRPDQWHRVRPRFDHALFLSRRSWTLNGIATKANEMLSSMDKAIYRRREDVPENRCAPSDATELKVNAKRRTQASIGKVGEEDLFRFTAAADGRYVIDTRGPDRRGHEALWAQQRDGADRRRRRLRLDTNARIAADLIAGDYFVQVRHYNRASGMGNYSVKVRKV